MNVIAVDDEHYALELCAQTIKDVLPDCSLSTFAMSGKALAYAQEHQVDIAFLDIEMASMNGIALAQRLKDIYSKTNIVFVTGYSEYALASYALDTTDYLLKPLSSKLVARALERLRDPVAIKADKRLRVHTFGNFELFVDGRPLVFAYAKTKELFAYLVHRNGALCSNNEIIAALWEDKLDTPSLKSHFRNLVSDLMQTLKSENITDIIIRKHGYIAVETDKFTCDCYDFKQRVPYAIKSYAGEYMSQYNWAEYANSFFSKR